MLETQHLKFWRAGLQQFNYTVSAYYKASPGLARCFSCPQCGALDRRDGVAQVGIV
ncbi:MAG: hypothetical protein Q8S26_17510 [Azonexus sp.]|nr:hypothetical protein [Azonexus sp.]